MRALVLALASLVSGCGMMQTCTDCMRPAAVEVVVKDGDTGAIIENALVSGTNRTTGMACGKGMGSCGDGCHALSGDASGTYAVTVTAAGYADASFTFDLESDGCGMWDGARREVKLKKTGAAEVTSLESALGCGH